MTDAELTILSLVAEGRRFGYEIQQVIDDRGLREWLTIGFSSIYYILNKLEKQDMLTSELRSDGRSPARKMYEITEAGRGVLQTAVGDLLRQPRALGTGFELGLANLHVLKPQQVYKVLTHHQTDLTQRLDLVAKAWERHQKSDAANTSDDIRALYTHSIALMQAELNWLTHFLADWRTRYPAVEERIEPQPRQADPGPAAVTQLHRRTTPEPVKMLQKLRRPGKPAEEEP